MTTVESCPVCLHPVEVGGADTTSYYFAGFANARDELIRAPEEMHLHVPCDRLLQEALDDADDWSTAITVARQLHNL